MTTEERKELRESLEGLAGMKTSGGVEALLRSGLEQALDALDEAEQRLAEKTEALENMTERHEYAEIRAVAAEADLCAHLRGDR